MKWPIRVVEGEEYLAFSVMLSLGIVVLTVVGFVIYELLKELGVIQAL